MTASEENDKPLQGLASLRDVLRRLYHGRTTAAIRFQLMVLAGDIVVIAACGGMNRMPSTARPAGHLLKMPDDGE